MEINYKLEYDISSCKKFVGYLNKDFDNIFNYYQYKFGGNYVVLKGKNNKWFDITNDYDGKMIMMVINEMEKKRNE